MTGLIDEIVSLECNIPVSFRWWKIPVLYSHLFIIYVHMYDA